MTNRVAMILNAAVVVVVVGLVGVSVTGAVVALGVMGISVAAIV